MELRKGTNGGRQIIAKRGGVRAEGPGRRKALLGEEGGNTQRAGQGRHPRPGKGEASAGVETGREWTSEGTQQSIWAEAGRGESMAPVQQPHTGAL